MANLVEVLLKAIDGVTPVVKNIDKETAKANKAMAEKWAGTGKAMQAVGIAATAVGVGLEMMARANAPLIESTRRLADYLDMDSKAMQQLVIDTSNVSFPLDEVLTLMETGARLGLDSAESLKKYAEFWDMVGDATGESSTALAEAGVSLKALGISAGEEGKALNAFGFIQRNTTMEVGEFINSIGRLAPEMKQLGIGVNEAAVIMGILQQEFGMTSRVAMQEFRTAVTSADGDIEKLKTTLGITGEMFDTYSQKVADSSEIISENARRNNELLTPMQNLQHWLTEVKYKMGDFIASAANYAPVLTGVGSAMTIVGTLMKSNFFPAIMKAASGVWSFTVSLLACPLTWVVIAITTTIAAVVKLIDVMKDAKLIREAEAASVKAQAEANEKLQKAYNLTDEEMIKVNQNLKDGKPLLDGVRESTDTLATSTTTLGTSSGESVPKIEGLGDAIGGVGTAAEESKEKLNEWGQVIETFEEWVTRVGEESKKLADDNKKLADESAKALETYEGAMSSMSDSMYELEHTEGEYALMLLNTISALNKKREEIKKTIEESQKSDEEQKKSMDEMEKWYELNVANIIKKLGEKKDALIESAKQEKGSALEIRAVIKGIETAYAEQISTINTVAGAEVIAAAKRVDALNAVKDAAKKAQKAADEVATQKKQNEPIGTSRPGEYKVYNPEGEYIGLTTNPNVLTPKQIKEGYTIKALPMMHEGGQVRTAIPGGEGLALLKDREIVSTPEQAASGNNITLNIHEGAFKVTTNKLDENAIKKAGKWLFDEFYSQCRANNIILQRG